MKLAIFEKITKNPLDFDYICYDTTAIHVSVQKCSLKYRGSSTNRKLRTPQNYSRRQTVFYLYLIIHFQAGNKSSEQPGLRIVTKKYTILEYFTETDQNRLKQQTELALETSGEVKMVPKKSMVEHKAQA